MDTSDGELHDGDLFLNNVISLLTDLTVQFNLHKELRCLEDMIFLRKENFCKVILKARVRTRHVLF